MAKKVAKKETKKAEPKKEVKVKKQCECRTEAGFRINPQCSTGTGCLA
tara:strand:- start:313 stop:456 length:144 start_codon:yes stop_codon:yes gene_type:complete